MYLVCGTLYDMFAVSKWALGIIYTYYITGFMCFVSAFPTATADQFQIDPCISLKINGLLWSMFQSRAQCHLLEGEIILVIVPACEWWMVMFTSHLQTAMIKVISFEPPPIFFGTDRMPKAKLNGQVETYEDGQWPVFKHSKTTKARWPNLGAPVITSFGWFEHKGDPGRPKFETQNLH